jgi:hypothetical protein
MILWSADAKGEFIIFIVGLILLITWSGADFSVDTPAKACEDGDAAPFRAAEDVQVKLNARSTLLLFRLYVPLLLRGGAARGESARALR